MPEQFTIPDGWEVIPSQREYPVPEGWEEVPEDDPMLQVAVADQLHRQSKELSATEGIGRGLQRGKAGIDIGIAGAIRGVKETSENLDRWASDLLGLDYDRDVMAGNPVLERRREDIEASKQVAMEAEEKIRSLPKSPSAEGIQPQNWRYWTEGISDFIPQLALQAGAAIGTGGGSILAQLGTFAVTGGTLEAGSAYQGARERGASVNTATAEALLVGSVVSALEMIPGSVLLRKNPAAKSFFDASLKRALASMGKRVGAGYLAEGGTEAAQEAWTDTVQWMAENDPEAYQEGVTRYANSFLLGGAAGGGFAAVGSVSGEGRRRRLQKKLEERTQLQEMRAKGVSRKDARDLGLSPEESQTKQTRNAAVDQRIQQAEKEAQDAIQEPKAKALPTRKTPEDRERLGKEVREEAREPEVPEEVAPQVPVEGQIGTPGTFRERREPGGDLADLSEEEAYERFQQESRAEKQQLEAAGRDSPTGTRLWSPDRAEYYEKGAGGLWWRYEADGTEIEQRGEQYPGGGVIRLHGWILESPQPAAPKPGQAQAPEVSAVGPVAPAAPQPAPEVTEPTPLQEYGDRLAGLPESLVRNTPIKRVQRSQVSEDADAGAAMYEHQTGTLHILNETSPNFQEDLQHEVIAAWAWANLTPEQYADWTEAVGRPPSEDVKGGVGGGMSNVDSFASSVLDWQAGRPWGKSGPFLDSLLGLKAEPPTAPQPPPEATPAEATIEPEETPEIAGATRQQVRFLSFEGEVTVPGYRVGDYVVWKANEKQKWRARKGGTTAASPLSPAYDTPHEAVAWAKSQGLAEQAQPSPAVPETPPAAVQEARELPPMQEVSDRIDRMQQPIDALHDELMKKGVPFEEHEAQSPELKKAYEDRIAYEEDYTSRLHQEAMSVMGEAFDRPFGGRKRKQVKNISLKTILQDVYSLGTGPASFAMFAQHAGPVMEQRDATVGKLARSMYRAWANAHGLDPELVLSKISGLTEEGKSSLLDQFQEAAAAAHDAISGLMLEGQPTQQAQPSPAVPETPQEALQEPDVAAQQEAEDTGQPGEAAIEDITVEQVPVANVQVDPRRFQFKGKVDVKGVQEPIEGQFDPLAAGVVTLWEDKSGKRFVVNGHHRVDLAQRANRENIQAYVLKESDGITANHAKMIGAELNIKEGQGTVDDYATFFRESGIEEAEAESRGLLARRKGKTGFLVGKFAANDVYDAFRSGQITAEVASTISDIGRDNEAIQNLGLARAKSKRNPKGMPASQLREFLSLSIRAPKRKSKGPKPKQKDLFGFDDSAIQEAEEMSKVASRIIEEKRERVRAVQGALRRPEKAQEMGLTGDMDAIQEEVSRLQEELAQWETWTTNPELTAQVRREAGIGEPAQAAIPGFEEEAAGVERAEERTRAKEKGKEEAPAPGKQEALFPKKGLAGQKNLFADTGVPEDMVQESEAEAAQRRAEEARPEAEAAGFGPGGGTTTTERLREDDIPEVIRAPEEQERRLQQAKGLKKPSLMRQIKDAVRMAMGVTRAQEHIPNTKFFAAANEFFRLLRNVPAMAQDEAIRTTAAITDRLGPKLLPLFERYTIMENLAASIAAGQPLRFGFQSAEEVDAYRAQLQSVVDRVPAVKEAIETRRKIVNETVDKLVEYGLLPAEAKDNANTYYHQQVHMHMAAKGLRGGGTRAGQTKRTFQRRRVLGEEFTEEELDYNTSYLESEISWLTDARMEIEKERLLRQLMDKYDSKPQLKEQAKRQNFENVVGGPQVAARIDQILGELAESRASEDAQDSAERMRRKQLIEELEDIDPTHPYRRQIAKMAGWFRKEQGLEADESLEPETDAEFWEMVKREADKGNVPALALFKALHQREQFIRDTLGEDYATWESLADEAEGQDIFQPEPGNQFYRAFTLPERIIEQLQNDVLDTADLSQDDLRQVLAMAGPRRQFVVPSEIAVQLAKTKKGEPAHGLALAADEAMRAWKVYTLLNPKRALAYNVRNLTGDIDPVVAADPTLLRHTDRALRELSRYHTGRLQLTPELRAARDYGVIGSGFVAEEVPDIQDLAVFRRFVDQAGKTKLPLRPIKGYMDIVKPLTQYREDALRYAAFLGYRDQLRKGRVRHYGGSKKAVVQQIKRDLGVDAAAAHLARNLLGDYGNISVAGNWIRRRLMPFWSFQEINLKRVPRLLVNAYESGGTWRTAGTLSAAAGRAILMSRVAWTFGALWAWNHLIQGGDEEEELADYDRAVPHIILGRNPDGSIRTFRRVGALGDFLEWFGINEAVAMLGKRRAGQVDTSDILKEMAFAMPTKAMNSLRPDLKALYELPTGTSLFPDPFQPRSARRGEIASHIVGLQDEYRWMKGWALGDGSTARPHYWQRWAVGVVDPRHSALSQTYDLRTDFLKKKGKEEKGVFPISKYKEARDAAKFEKYDAFVDWKRKYVEERGDKAQGDFKDWLGTLDPIANRLNDVYELEFEKEFLTNEQRQRLTVARNYAHELRDLLVSWWDADDRSQPMKKEVTYSAFRRMGVAEPDRDNYESQDKFDKAVAKFQLDNQRAARDIQSMTSSHEEAQELLVHSFWTVKGDKKLSELTEAGDYRASYMRVAMKIDKFYGKSMNSYRKWRVTAGFTGPQWRQKRDEWESKRP